MDVKGIDKNKVRLKIKVFAPIVEWLTRGIIGFLLARGLIFAEYAPFGIAWCAAGGAPGTIGAILGYISVLYKVNSLKYMAICILIYTAGYIFRDTQIVKRALFMPCAALISTASIGFVFVIESSNPLKSAAFYIAEVLITALCTYFYQLSQKGRSEQRQKAGMALLVATLILPLSAIYILGISLGRVVACLLLLTMGYFGGSAAGSATGIVLAFAMGGGPLSAIYGICGLISPVFKSYGVKIYTAVFLTLAVTSMLWITMEVNSGFLCEFAVGVASFFAVSKFFSDKLISAFRPKEKLRTYNSLQKQLEERINRASDAFSELALIFTGVKKNEKAGFTSVFDAPAQKVCKRCVLSKNCWEREFIKTKEALEHAINAIEKRGELAADDFPVYFSARCIKIEEFIAEANRELFKILYRKKYMAQIDESRGILKRQYGEMSKILSGLKDELNLSPDLRYEAKIADFFEKNEITAYPTVYRDGQNHICVQVAGERLNRICCAEFARDLSAFLGVKVTVPVFDGETECASFRQRENLKVVLGASMNKKKGNRVSGDAGSYYRTEDGALALILADGMGSGTDASYISSNAIKIAERFHRAKIDMSLSLSAINTALSLKADESPGFTTMDFMELNLYNGRTKLYKLGSAPTYIRHNGRVRRIIGTSLPAGVPAPSQNTAECFEMQAYPKDFMVFITDGVTDATADTWLVELIEKFKGDSARELAGEIIASAAAKYGSGDDMTVLVVYVDKNE